MTTDFRSLCAELIDALDSGIPAGRIRMSPLANRARAALAEPQPEPPTEREVTKLVAWLLEGGEDAAANGWDHQARQFGRAAELLQRLQPELPTTMEIIELADEIEAAGLGQVDLVRAALARWSPQ